MIDGYRQHGSPLTDKQISDFQNAFGIALSAGALPKAIALAAPKAIGWALMNPEGVAFALELANDLIGKTPPTTPLRQGLNSIIQFYEKSK